MHPRVSCQKCGTPFKKTLTWGWHALFSIVFLLRNRKFSNFPTLFSSSFVSQNLKQKCGQFAPSFFAKCNFMRQDQMEMVQLRHNTFYGNEFNLKESFFYRKIWKTIKKGRIFYRIFFGFSTGKVEKTFEKAKIFYRNFDYAHSGIFSKHSVHPKTFRIKSVTLKNCQNFFLNSKCLFTKLIA